MQIRLLGQFTVVVAGVATPDDAWRRRHAAALVKVLALTPRHELHREQILDALWPDLTVDDAAPRLHKAAHFARRAMGDPANAIVLRGETVALLPGTAITVDALEFEAKGEAARVEGSPGAAAAALELYGGLLLPADLYEPWAEPGRERLRLLYLDLLRQAGRFEQLLAEDPADEEAHLAVMRTLVDAGDRRAALRQYERMDRALQRELGVGPSPEAVALRDELLESLPGVPADVVAVSPDSGVLGRDDELAGFERVLDQAEAGRGRTILLSGPPGVGKSALLAEMRERAARRGFRTGRGVAAAFEGAWPYAPVLEAFADLARRHPTLLDGLDDSFRAEIERALAGADLDWSGDGGHQRLFVAAGELLRLAAAGSGLLVTIDDVHEADEASLRFLHYLARCSLGEQVVIVLASRDGAGATTAPAFERVRSSLLSRNAADELVLEPFDRDATAELLARAAPSASIDHVDEVFALSGGLAFSIVELARELARDPQATGLSGATALTGLDPSTRDALQRVAVLGATFATDEFIALSGLADDDAYHELDAALAARVVERTTGGYQFRHALLREALLDVPAHRHFELHRGAADRLTDLGASPARIGHHLLQAGDPEAAVPFVLRAAETEAALGAFGDALALVESVSSSVAGADRFQMLALRANLLIAVGSIDAMAACREALLAAPPEASRAMRVRLARAAVFSGDLDTAVFALEGLEPDGSPSDAGLLLVRASLAYFDGDLEAAWEFTGRARRLVLEGRATEWGIVDVVALQGLIAHNRGEWFERLRVELRRTTGAPELATAIFDSHLCVAEYLLYGPTPYAEVIALARDLRATAERAGVLRAVAFAAALMGEAALLSGDLDAAARELQEAADLHREIGAPAGEAHSLQRLAEVHLARGERAEATRLAQRALPLARWSSLALHLIQRVYGTLIRAAPDAEAARAVVDRADATLGRDDLCLFCSIMLEVPAAIACADVGDLDAARAHLEQAEVSNALWEGTSWHAAILEAGAHISLASGGVAEARSRLDEAAEVFGAAGQPLDAQRCLAALADLDAGEGQGKVPSVPSSHAPTP